MAITRKYNVPLSTISTFQIGGTVSELAIVETEHDLQEVFEALVENEVEPLKMDAVQGTSEARDQGVHERYSAGANERSNAEMRYFQRFKKKWFILGGGSNVVFPDGDSDILLIQFAPQNIRFEKIDDDTVHLIAPAGVNWDTVVEQAVAHGLSGMEALSAIPGSVGATPIQNVGAYGTEIKDILHSVRAFDIQDRKFVTLSNIECEFGYRDSMFKHKGRGRYIITEVTYVLSTDEPNVPQYLGVSEYFASKGIVRATLQEIRDAIIYIRSTKLPDPKEIASVGSFFKNPFVPKDQAEKLKAEYPTLAVFPINENISKVGAGSLIDTAGLKGKCFGNISIYKGNALVLVNEGGATREELKKVVAIIIEEVEKKFGITLDTEPELLEF